MGILDEIFAEPVKDDENGIIGDTLLGAIDDEDDGDEETDVQMGLSEDLAATTIIDDAQKTAIAKAAAQVGPFDPVTRRLEALLKKN